MDLLSYQKDMFGQMLLTGVNWDHLWVPVVAGLAVILAHQLIKRVRKTS